MVRISWSQYLASDSDIEREPARENRMGAHGVDAGRDGGDDVVRGGRGRGDSEAHRAAAPSREILAAVRSRGRSVLDRVPLHAHHTWVRAYRVRPVPELFLVMDVAREFHRLAVLLLAGREDAESDESACVHLHVAHDRARAGRAADWERAVGLDELAGGIQVDDAVVPDRLVQERGAFILDSTFAIR